MKKKNFLQEEFDELQESLQKEHKELSERYERKLQREREEKRVRAIKIKRAKMEAEQRKKEWRKKLVAYDDCLAIVIKALPVVGEKLAEGIEMSDSIEKSPCLGHFPLCKGDFGWISLYYIYNKATDSYHFRFEENKSVGGSPFRQNHNLHELMDELDDDEYKDELQKILDFLEENFRDPKKLLQYLFQQIKSW